MSDDPLKPQLWKPRSVKETLKVYADWADTYDKDVVGGGYHTPDRIAAALLPFLAGGGPILDFGCGTGVSGQALTKADIGPLHGTDISAEMLAQARTKGVYEKLWQSQPGTAPAEKGAYRAVVAAGVISLGAAPPETLDLLLGTLDTGGLMGLSFNDPTLQDGSYDKQLQAAVEARRCEVLFREHGPHLVEMSMGSDVIVLRVT